MVILNAARIEFEDSMSGYIGEGQTYPLEGREVGQDQGTELRFNVRISIDDLGRFVKTSDHEARLTGTVIGELFGGEYDISDGMPCLFSLDGN